MNDFKLKESVKNTLLKFNMNYIAQEYFFQSNFLMSLHGNSLITIGIISLRYEKKFMIFLELLEWETMGTYLTMQHLVGRLVVLITPVNSMISLHNTIDLKKLKYPHGNFIFKDKSIPEIEDICILIYRDHDGLTYFDIGSLGIGVSPGNTPVIVKVNLRFQDINFHQRSNSPLFGELTTEILDQCLIRK